jgi:hypothetical protein
MALVAWWLMKSNDQLGRAFYDRIKIGMTRDEVTTITTEWPPALADSSRIGCS